MLSQAQVIGRPKPQTWDEYESGCMATFHGGYRDPKMLDAFQHGMETVFNLLRHEFKEASECVKESA